MTQSNDISKDDYELPDHIKQDHDFVLDDFADLEDVELVRTRYYHCQICRVMIQINDNYYFRYYDKPKKNRKNDPMSIGYVLEGEINKPFISHEEMMIEDIIT